MAKRVGRHPTRCVRACGGVCGDCLSQRAHGGREASSVGDTCSPEILAGDSLRRSSPVSVRPAVEAIRRRSRIRTSTSTSAAASTGRDNVASGSNRNNHFSDRRKMRKPFRRRRLDQANTVAVVATAAVLYCCCSSSSSRVAASPDGVDSIDAQLDGYASSATTLWDIVSRDPDYTKLTACIQMADPAIRDALSGSDANPLTLFAPKDSAFEHPDWNNRRNRTSDAIFGGDGAADDTTIFSLRCTDEASATALMSYHVSTTAPSTPYIGEEFKTLRGADFSAYYFGIPKSPDVAASAFPIQFINDANITATPTSIASGGTTSYLFPVDRVLRPPVGTIWETLTADPSFSMLAKALNTTALARSLDTLKGASYTLFAPDDAAIEASQNFPEDPASLEVLLSFHTLAAGVYPLSITGAHFSQQLFKVDPAGRSLTRDYYNDFYAKEFQGGEVTSLAGPLLNVTRASTFSTASSASASCGVSRQEVRPPSSPSMSMSSSLSSSTFSSSPSTTEIATNVFEGEIPNPNLASDPKSLSGSMLLCDEDLRTGAALSSDRSFLLSAEGVEVDAPSLLPSSTTLMINGVPVSEADIPATNGVIHRLSAAVMDPPSTVLGVLLNPPFPLSAAGAAQKQRGGGRRQGRRNTGGLHDVREGQEMRDGEGFKALRDLIQLSWPLVNATLTEDGPFTVLAPTDAAFDVAIAAGKLPPRPWINETLSSSVSSAGVPSLTPERAARLLLSHTLRTPDGPLVFSPTAKDPFSSGFTSGDRYSTAVPTSHNRPSTTSLEASAVDLTVSKMTRGTDSVVVQPGELVGESTAVREHEGLEGGWVGDEEGSVEVEVRVVEMETRSATIGTDEVVDREVYIDGARVVQCVGGAGTGHDCGSAPRPSNTYALNGAHLCVVHAIDRVIFPADPGTDLAAVLDNTPSLSRFSGLLKEHGLSPVAAISKTSKSNTLHKAASRRGGGTAQGRDGAGVFTVFAPTNDALARLEEERTWLFQNSSSLGAREGSSGDQHERGVSEGETEEEWSPVRELLAYHLVPGDALFSRYFNASSYRAPTAALHGTAPIAASLAPTSNQTCVADDNLAAARNRRPRVTNVDGEDYERSASTRSMGGVWTRAGVGAAPGTVDALLRVNLQVCSSTDISASNGVLHVLAYVDDRHERKDTLVDIDDDITGYDGQGEKDIDGDPVSLCDGDGAGVLVPDVLELTYAFGFRQTYEAILAASTVGAGASSGGRSTIDSHQTSSNTAGGTTTYDTQQGRAHANLSGGSGAAGTVAGSGTDPSGGEGTLSLADVLRGSAAHTLLVVQDTEEEDCGSSSWSASREASPEKDGLSADALRYQTLIGDQMLQAFTEPSISVKTLFGADAHVFNNSENPSNPFVPGNGSGLNIDQAQVLSFDGDMIALNGRIHEISEPLRAPAPDIFSLLSSRSELSGWADWVEETRLAEVFADPRAGPFTVFAPVDSSLELIPGRIALGADTDSLASLVRFHVAVGLAEQTMASTTSSGAKLRMTIGAGLHDDVLIGQATEWRRQERVTRGTGDGAGSRSARDVGDSSIGRRYEGKTSASASASASNTAQEGGRLFTSSLANATLAERTVLSGRRFASGRPLRTLLGDDVGCISVQVAAPIATSADPDDGAGGRSGEVRAGSTTEGSGVRVFVGPGPPPSQLQRKMAEIYGRGTSGRSGSNSGKAFAEPLHLGAFAAEVVLPNLNAVNGVVHGISGVMTYPGYARPAVPIDREES